MERKAGHDIARKLKVLNHAKEHGNISKTCRYYRICRETFYTWRRSFESGGNNALINNKPCPGNHQLRVLSAIEGYIVYWRSTYHFSPDMIVWHLPRYHDIKVSRNGCYQVLKRNKLNRLPDNIKKRSRYKFMRFDKKVPGYHVQVDVNFFSYKDEDVQRIKRFQYPAIDDCTRISALKIYEHHNQTSSIDFINYVVNKFPFRVKTIRTDNGHEFQTKFQWHVSDLSMLHVYIKPATPRLNGKVERSHLTDKRAFYQVLDDDGDVNLRQKRGQWESYYNFLRATFSTHGKNA